MPQRAIVILYGAARRPQTYTRRVYQRLIAPPSSAAGLPIPPGAQACAWSRGGDWSPWRSTTHLHGARIELLGWSHQPDQFPLVYAGLQPGTTLLDLPTAAGLTWWTHGAADLPGGLLTSAAGAAVLRYLGQHALDRIASECGGPQPHARSDRAAAQWHARPDMLDPQIAGEP